MTRILPKICASAATAQSLQSCLTLCDPIDSSPPGSPVAGILQARTLEWVAISFSNAWKQKVKVKSLGRVLLFSTPWTAAYQAPLSMGFSRQEYWTGGNHNKCWGGQSAEGNRSTLFPCFLQGMGTRRAGWMWAPPLSPGPCTACITKVWPSFCCPEVLRLPQESRLLGEVSIISDMQMTPPLWQKVKKNWRASWWKWKSWLKTQHSKN